LAHVQPEGAAFDDLGRGVEEGQRNFAQADSDTVQSPIDMIRRVSSTGYLRKRLPQELVVLQGGSRNLFGLSNTPVGTSEAIATVASQAAPVVHLDARTKAKMQGYEGDSCGECGNYTLVRNGTCMKCNTCGGTSGCS
jgi:ribonucleoside-diphosphate reductase alpha chain